MKSGLAPDSDTVIHGAARSRVAAASTCARSGCSSHGLPRCPRRQEHGWRRLRGARHAAQMLPQGRSSAPAIEGRARTAAILGLLPPPGLQRVVTPAGGTRTGFRGIYSAPSPDRAPSEISSAIQRKDD